MLISLRLCPNPWDTKLLILKWPGVPSVHTNHSTTLIPSWIPTARNRARLINLRLGYMYGLCSFAINIGVLQICESQSLMKQSLMARSRKNSIGRKGKKPIGKRKYSQSSPCTHSLKWPALTKTTFVKHSFNCDIYFVMKSSHKQPLPWTTATTFGINQMDFPFVLKLFSATTQSLNSYKSSYNETEYCADKDQVWCSISCAYIRYKDTP